ncbi:MAG: hypothetical protein FJX47_19210, partial [Alphaproteobacteria bacterium]|nr:hypothetical protein [Alphaproteobacteria bacterium]
MRRERTMSAINAARTLLATLLILMASAVMAQEKRVALVIGNGKYAHAIPLANPANDGRGMAAALKRLGFAVTESYDESRAGMERALRGFRQTARASDMALVFYAGHAVQVGAKNHLLPTDAKLADEDDLNYETIPLDLVLSAVEGASKVRVVILDSCRDNPFNAKLALAMGPGRSASIGRGLAVAPVGGGNTLIAYATKEGLIAEDGKGARNSPYTTALLRHIEEPGLDLNQFFGRVRDTVMAATGGQQQPFVYGSLGGERFFLKAPDGTATYSPPPAPAPVDPATVELAYWNSVKDSQNAGEYEAYLKEYPKGRFAALARTRIAALTPKPAPTAPKPVQPAVGTYDLAPGQVFRDCADCPEMVVIPAGSFVMGVVPGEEEREGVPDQFKGRSVPQHSVNVRSFMLGKYEVTVGEFARFVNETGHRTDGGCFAWNGTKWDLDASKNWRNPGFGQGDRHPVACVSWDDAKAYTAWLSRKTGKSYRLASEAEWEYGARAGTSTARHWGNDGNQGCGFANTADQTAKSQVPGASNWATATCNDGHAYTAPVGSFRTNGFGLHDMIGNVLEWTEDCWNENYNGAPTDGSAWLSGNCNIRVLRGGSWSFSPWGARSALRLRLSSVDR